MTLTYYKINEYYIKVIENTYDISTVIIRLLKEKDEIVFGEQRQAIHIPIDSAHCWYPSCHYSHNQSRVRQNGFISRSIILYIANPLTRCGIEFYLHKLSRYGITGSLFLLIKSFIRVRFIMIIVNTQSSDVHEINAGVLQC